MSARTPERSASAVAKVTSERRRRMRVSAMVSELPWEQGGRGARSRRVIGSRHSTWRSKRLVPDSRCLVLPSSLPSASSPTGPTPCCSSACLRQLALAIGAAREDGVLTQVTVALIDNSEDPKIAERSDPARQVALRGLGRAAHFLHGHANIGYGVAHNLMLHGTGARLPARAQSRRRARDRRARECASAGSTRIRTSARWRRP